MKNTLCSRLTGLVALVLLLGAAAPAPDPDSPVADAAMEGDAETVRTLIERGADVNAPRGDGMTALHWAAKNGDVEIARLLVSAGADLHAGTRNGQYTPLHVAARQGRDRIVTLLLEAGADPGAATTTTGVQPLHLAARAGSVGAIRALLDHGAEVDARETGWDQTPLIFAADFGRVGAVELLLERGADPSITERSVYLPTRAAVDEAAEAARDEVLASFREQSPNPDQWRATPSQVQAAMDAAQAIQALPPEEVLEPEDNGGEEDEGPRRRSYEELVGHQGGLSALHHAAREGHTDVVHALLDGGADIDQRSDGEHVTPLLIAGVNGHFDLMLELLDRGADPRLADEAGVTPLFAVINIQWAPKARYPQQEAYKQQEATYLEVMEALLEAGADPNVRLKRHLWHMEYNFSQLSVNTWGATPFWRAAHSVDVDAMKLLVEYGADPTIPTRRPPERRRRYSDEDQSDEPDPSGLPPVPAGGPGVPPVVAAAGVGYGGGDGSGRAGVSHRHAPEGWLPAMKYLVEELGADVNARDHNGYTPLHFAAGRGDNELIRYLVDRGADVTAVNRRGQTTVDMANGPVQRIQPFPETIALLESMGAKNNNNCLSC